MNKFSDRLNESLKSNQVSQSELARRINMSQGVVNSYCVGRKKPSLDVFTSICTALDESADYLLGFTDL